MAHKHTPGPWQAINDTVCDDKDRIIAHVLTSQYEPDGLIATDARRIVACVNACAGLPTEELEQFHATNLSDGIKLIAVTSQRDELVEICNNVIERGIGARDIKAMESAIAKATGGAT